VEAGYLRGCRSGKRVGEHRLLQTEHLLVSWTTAEEPAAAQHHCEEQGDARTYGITEIESKSVVNKINVVTSAQPSHQP